MKRRDFLKLSCGVAAGAALSGLGIDLLAVEAHAAELTKAELVKKALQTTTVCCYCAVGCGLICSTDKKSGQIINIEGDPEHPINEGSLCAKGAGIYQTSAANDKRLTKVLYRAPYTDSWVEKDWDFAIDRIARKIKEERDKSFVYKNAKARRLTVWKAWPTSAVPTLTAKNAGQLPYMPVPSAWCTLITKPVSDTVRLYRLWQSRSDAGL